MSARVCHQREVVDEDVEEDKMELNELARERAGEPDPSEVMELERERETIPTDGVGRGSIIGKTCSAHKNKTRPHA